MSQLQGCASVPPCTLLPASLSDTHKYNTGKYNVTFRRLCATTVAVEKQYCYILWVCERYPASKAHAPYYTGLFKMIVGVLTTCHTQYTWDQGRIKLFGAPRQWKHFRPLFQAVFLSGGGYYPPDWVKHHASQSLDRNNKYFILYIEFCINNKI